MPTPYSTVVTDVTVTNNSAIPVTNLSTVNVIVTFPDASTESFALGNGITYLGSGAYSLVYNTRGTGRTNEEWYVYTTSSTPQAQFRNYYQVVEGTA